MDYPNTALIDADVLRYEMGSLTQTHPFIPKERIPVETGFLESRLKDKIEIIKKSTGCNTMIFYFSEGGNFRFDVAKQQKYKGNRDGTERPFHWKTVDSYIKKNYNYIEVYDREADDVLSETQRKSEGTIICTRDKDLLTTPGWHYRWRCGESQKEVLPYLISETEAWYHFFYQMLVGDHSDNILGCGKKLEVKWGNSTRLRRSGIAKKKALELLKDVNDKWTYYHIVRMEYFKMFEDDYEDIMLENARLLFVGQSKDNLFDFSWLDKHWK